MNITVITPFDSSNYGAFLQAYCLKLELEKLGHTVFHTPTRDSEYVRNLYYRNKPVRKKEKLFRIRFEKNKKFGMRKYQIFSKDIESFNVKNIESPSDLYILGSDEIWNVKQASFEKPIFWGIGLDPVIAYATSIGSASEDLLRKYPEQINAVRKLKALMVRDEKTKNFVETITGMKADIVCDPTMLIPINEYGREFHDKYLEENDCLLVYAYSTLSKKCIEAIKSYAKTKNMKVVGCCFNHSWCDHICECSPLEFSSLIRQCKAVITATFHGSIFSILNHSNFLSIPYSPKTNQLLSQFRLEDRLLEQGDCSAESIASILDSSGINYEAVDQKILNVRQKSEQLLKEGIKRASVSKTFDYQICPSDKCSACFACMNKCAKNAIGVTKDIYGRTLPMIDPQKCVQCGMCKKVCPVNQPVKLTTPLKCYAAVRKDEKEHKKSASGGIGAVIAERIINEGGVAYGAAFEADGNSVILKHTKAKTLKEAEKFRGSKYVQSDIGLIYRDVLSELKTGKKVLFTGTPCQIGGLKNYLGKDYNNLYCVDLICHGVPPMEYLRQHLETVAKDKKVTDVTFRIGKRDFVLFVKSGREDVYTIFRDQDTYYKSFICAQNFRENCYQCSYACPNRCSDISIGDYWLDKKTLKHSMSGKITVVTANTDKGQSIVGEIKSDVIIEERDYEEAKQLNGQLNRPSTRYFDRDLFLDVFKNTQNIEQSINSTSVRKDIDDYNFLYTTIPGRILLKFFKLNKNGKWK